MLEENTADNVHILDQTLFLSSVTGETSGDYVCTVTNQAGTTSSNVMVINVPGETWHRDSPPTGFQVILLLQLPTISQ